MSLLSTLLSLEEKCPIKDLGKDLGGKNTIEVPESEQLGCYVSYTLLIQNKHVLRLSSVRWLNFWFPNQFNRNHLGPAVNFDVFYNINKISFVSILIGSNRLKI